MNPELLIWLLPLPPLLAFFFIVLFTNRTKWLSHTIAVGAAGLSFIGTMILIYRAIQIDHLGKHPIQSTINWLPTGDTWLQIGVMVESSDCNKFIFRINHSINDIYI